MQAKQRSVYAKLIARCADCRIKNGFVFKEENIELWQLDDISPKINTFKLFLIASTELL